MKSICDPFIRRPIATILLAISITLLGIASYRKLQVNALPKVDYPVIQVSASYPGMSAEMMANSIASPLEKEFMEIDGMKEVRSESRLGATSLTLNFNLNKSIDIAAMEVQAAITRAQPKLPQDMPSTPSYRKQDPNSQPIYFMALVSDSMTTAALYDYAKTKIGQQLTKIEGVSQVRVFGVPRAVRVNLDNRKLRLLGISFGEVTKAIQQHTMILSMGRLKGEFSTLTLTSNGQLPYAKDYKKIVIKTVQNKPIYLEDVARCEDGVEEEDFASQFWADGVKINMDSVIVLAVSQAPGANTVEVSTHINAMLPQLYKSLPSSITLHPIYDKAKSILDSINEVKETIVIAFVLVAVVIFLFLGRARETIIPVVAMPLSLLITFLVMKLLGYSLDNLSLMALTLAIGFLVDDAIVFLENVVRHMEEGLTPLEAAFKGASEISFTILSMTFSLMATFIPIVFMDGQIGRVFREFSITIVVAILASGIVSLTVTPVMCARFLKKHEPGDKTPIERFAYNFEHTFLKWYRKRLSWFLEHRWISWWTWTACVILMVFFFIKLPKSFLPDGDSSAMFGMFMTQTGTSPEQMHKYQEQIKTVVSKHPAVKITMNAAGLGSFMAGNQGVLLVVLKDIKERKSIRNAKDVSINAISKEIQGMLFQVNGVLPLLKPIPVLDIQTSSSDSKRGKYFYTLTGTETDQVNQAAAALLKKFATIPGIDRNSLNCNVDNNDPVLSVDYHRRRLFQYGLTPYHIENALKEAFSLNYSYLIKGDTEQYQVIVASQKDQRKHIQDINNMCIINAKGEMLPMNALISMHQQVGPVSVFHKDNFPSADIFFNLSGKAALSETLEAIEKAAAEICTNGIEGSIGGESQEFQASMKSLTFLLFVAIFVMYVVLGCLYEHWIHPLTVLSTLPIALAGGLLTLTVFGAEFSLYAFIGLFMLMGIIKKNGIILVDFAVEKQRLGETPENAIVDACCERFRPILMTTVSTVFGILPIALGLGADGASRIPLGLCVAGGLTFAQVLTLFVTPVIYLGMNRFCNTSKQLDA
jgi:hydrophobic/amphiphilic exporter-1 (mainly G- bacteria), HAE1 family